MLKIPALVLLFVATVYSNPVLSNVRITRASSVPRNPIGGLLQLNKAENCGYSIIHETRLPHCTSAPCTFTRGHFYSIEVDFTTRDRRWDPFFRSILAHGSEIQVIQDDLDLRPDIRLEGNTRYTFTYDFIIPADGFTGGKAELRFKIYQNMVAELCVVIPSTIINS